MQMSTRNTVWAALALLILACQGSLLYGQIGRASITGVVHDATGAVLPGATIKVTNAGTGVVYEGTSNEVGNYTVSSLPVGDYSVSFTAKGFKEYLQKGFTLISGQIVRLDPSLALGQAQDQITVTTEAPLLQTESSQASESVSAQVFADLPLSFGGQGRNMAVFADKLVPGVRGSSYGVSIQGNPGASAGILIDGMTNLAGFLPGDFGEASVSPEAIQELTVLTGNVSAEQGRQSGGTLSFTLKSGGNSPHGSVFYYLRNEVLNANNWNNNLYLAADPTFSKSTTASFKRPLDRRKDYGFTAGGPIYIPKIYDGRNRTFAQFTMERFNTATTGPGSLSWSVPQPEMWKGDLSRLMTGTKVGTDATGRDVYEGQIFDPGSLRQVNGRYVADPFVGNIIPTNRISTVAQNFAKVFNEWYQPVNTSITNNMFTPTQNRQDVKQYTLKVDHSFSVKHKVSGYYYKHGFPRNFQENVSEVWSLKDPDLGGPLSRSIRQQRRGYSWNAGYDWIATPTLVNHLMVGLNNNANAFQSRQVGKQFADSWGIKGVGLGVPDNQVTRPLISLGSSPVVTFQSWNHDANRDEFYRSIVISNTTTWQKGAHTLKFGIEWNFLRYDSQQYNNTGGTFNFAARTTAIPGETFTARLGNSFASFLLGQVNSATLGPIFEPLTTRHYGAAFAQDSWKMSSNLTLSYGIRWSGNSPQYEENDRIANFNPTLIDPNFGRPGAVEYMGDGAGRAGRRAPFNGNWNDFGPTTGLAYKLSEKTVLRAGYGISYTPEAFGWTYPWIAPFNDTNEAAADSKGTYLPVFNIDNGFPSVTVKANMNPSYAALYGGTRYAEGYVRSGYVQNFNLGVQHEMFKDISLELEYRGSVGNRLHSGGNVTPNQIDPKELSRGAALTQTISSAAQATAAGLPYPYAGFSGLGAYTLLPFPQLQSKGLTAFGDPVGVSTYHSLNLIATKRMAKGYYLYTAYTFSKNIANVQDVSNGGGGGGIQDTYNRTHDKSITSTDRTHVIKSAINWELPLGKGKWLLGNSNRILDAIVGGWNLSAILNYQSGTPLGHPSSRTRPNFWNGPGVYANFATPSGGFNQTFNPDTFNPWNAADPGNRFFDTSAFSDAATQSLGNSPNRFPTVRGLWSWNEDATLSKFFQVREQVHLQVRLETFNLLNRHSFAGPDMTMSNASFGNVRTASGNRSAQLGARLEW
jgi:hypothetical protein